MTETIEGERERVLAAASELAGRYLDGLPDRPVGPRADAEAVIDALGRDLPQQGEDSEIVIREMATAVEPGLMASAGPRFFGFVFGGALPASVGADWLTAAWDQNAVLHAASPAAAAAEQVAGEWLLDLLGLPEDASFGLTGGAGLANVVALAAARHAVLERVGWDVEARGLFGAPEIRVLVGDEAHATLESALQYLGLGRERVVRVPTDDQGRMQADAFATQLGGDDEPTIVCTQAGNVNTGACDPIGAIAERLAGHPNAWHHVDGAFGLWACRVAALPRPRRGRGAGRLLGDRRAQVAERRVRLRLRRDGASRGAPRRRCRCMARTSSRTPTRRDGSQWLLDSSRRARGFAVYATLRSLGRDGVRDLVERCCALAARIGRPACARPPASRS